MSKTKPTYILKNYRIWNNKKSRFYSFDGNSSWDDVYHLIRSVNKFRLEVYEHPEHGWVNLEEWYRLEGKRGRSPMNYPTRFESDQSLVDRLFGDYYELVEILLTENFQSYVRRYTMLEMLTLKSRF